jgi:hypothetical protein
MRNVATALAAILALASCARREGDCPMSGASNGARSGGTGAVGALSVEAGTDEGGTGAGPGGSGSGGVGVDGDAGARATGDDAGGAATGPQADWSTEFVARGDQWPVVASQSGGSVDFGYSDPAAQDGYAARLVFPGVPGLGPGDRAGASYETEIETAPTFTYGTYRARFTVPSCDASEEVVSGFFTYFNDGNDYNGNGIADNSEVDIELLCGSPHVISMAVWTDFTSDKSFLVMGASVDLATGSLFESTAPNVYGQSFVGMRPELLHPEYPDPTAYYEMGFDWHPSEVRFFIVLGGAEVTLWRFTDPARIPSLRSMLGFNMWHTSTHWAGDDSPANYPAHDAVMRIDWLRYAQ